MSQQCGMARFGAANGWRKSPTTREVAACVTLLLALCVFAGMQSQRRQAAPRAAQLSRLSVGPEHPELFVVSRVDAALEAAQNTPERQFYIDHRVITLGPGDVVIDVGANIGSFARMASLMVASPSVKPPTRSPTAFSGTFSAHPPHGPLASAPEGEGEGEGEGQGEGKQSGEGKDGYATPSPSWSPETSSRGGGSPETSPRGSASGAGGSGSSSPGFYTPGTSPRSPCGAGSSNSNSSLKAHSNPPPPPARGAAGAPLPLGACLDDPVGGWGGRGDRPLARRSAFAGMAGPLASSRLQAPALAPAPPAPAPPARDPLAPVPLAPPPAGPDVRDVARSGSQGLVLAIEPLHLVYQALKLNAQQHRQWAVARGRAAAPIVPVQCGVGSGSTRQATFTFYPKCTAFSTMFPNETDALHATVALVVNGAGTGNTPEPDGTSAGGKAPTSSAHNPGSKAHNPGTGPHNPGFEAHNPGHDSGAPGVTLGFKASSGERPGNGTAAGTSWLQWLGRQFVRSPLGVMYRPLHMAVFKTLFLSGAQQMQCRMVTLSDLIRQYNLREVSLLKINVERAEEEVLMGVEPQHWPLIQQVAMQLHDLAGRLDRLEELLHAKGFITVVRWQEPRFKGCSLWMLYASRRAI